MFAVAIVNLCRDIVSRYPKILQGAVPQSGEDSRLDMHKSITNQFSLLRIVDNERCRAFFESKGHRYIVKIEKEDKLRE